VGELLTQTVNGKHSGVDYSYTQNFTYDSVNRLRSVWDSGIGTKVMPIVEQQMIPASQYFRYDRHGNRALLNGSERPGSSLTPVVNDMSADVAALFPSNRLSLNSYDSAGNTTVFGPQTQTYDGEGRLMTSSYPNPANGSETLQWQYSYDGAGRRVRATKFRNPGAVQLSSIVYLYGADGQLLVERGAPPSAYVNGREYVHQDALGTVRLTSKATGTLTDIVSKRFDYLPFGEDIARVASQGYGGSMNPKFTGKERDAETGLDYFGARYMSAAQGRFTSPDPHNEGVQILNPQSWNAYSYTINSPLIYVDPDGEDYRLCLDGKCENVSDAAYNAWRRSRGDSVIVRPGGQILDRETEKPIGSATWFDGDAARRTSDSAAFVSFFALERATTLASVPLEVFAAGFWANKLAPPVVTGIIKQDGNVAVHIVRAQLGLKGYRIVGEQVRAVTSKGARVVDIIAERGGKYVAFEVKSGKGRNAMQIAKDVAMETEGAVIGKAQGGVQTELTGQTMKLKTIEVKP
jgi:RHS repeat-associated protein